MARVVQQRTSPPYLTIVFVFLFLVATTLAVVFYLEADKTKKGATDDRATLGKLATGAQLNDSRVRQLMQGRDTAVGKMLEQIEKLTTAITGQASDADEAIEQANTLAAQIQSNQGLANDVTSLLQATAAAGMNIQTLKNQLAEKGEALAAKTAQIDELIAQQAESMAQVRLEVTGLQTQLARREDELRAQLDQAMQQWQENRANLDTTVATGTQENEQLRLELQQTRAEVDRMKKLLRPEDPAKKAMPLPDGEILDVVLELDLVYINLGKSHNLRPGQTFSVYPPTGIAEDAEKGKLVVTNVEDDIAGCKIVEQKDADPIIIGDLIGNVAFDRTRTYSFIVAGYFDLYGSGKASSAGTEEVKMMIREHGGKVIGKLDIQTDFLVLGLAPAQPTKPRPDDPPAAHSVYTEQMKIYSQYQNVVDQALDLNVPILTTNRFLAFIGYSPQQATASIN